MNYNKLSKFIHWFFIGMGLLFLVIGGGVFGYTWRWLAQVPVLLVLPGVFMLLGLVFVLVGVALRLAAARREKKAEEKARRLKSTGVLIQAEYLDCLAGRSVITNTRPVVNYIVRCTWRDAAGKTYIFSQKDVEEDPGPFLRGGMLNVYYNPQDINDYFVDVRGSYDSEVIEL